MNSRTKNISLGGHCLKNEEVLLWSRAVTVKSMKNDCPIKSHMTNLDWVHGSCNSYIGWVGAWKELFTSLV